jgi:uncharacterized membrane protein
MAVAPGRRPRTFPLWGSVGLPAAALWGTLLGLLIGLYFGNGLIGAAIGAALGVGIGFALFAAAVVSASKHF